MNKIVNLACIFLLSLCLSLVALCLSAPATAQAQMPPPPPGGPGGPGLGGPEMGPPPEAALKEALSLTDEQMSALQTLQETRMATVQSIMPRLATAEKALDEALKSGLSDAAQLGNLQLAAKGYRDQMAQADQALATGFKSLLTADQLTKLNQYLAMKDSLPVLMALQRMRL